MKNTKMIRIVEVPVGATAEEAEALLNQPYEQGYYFMQLLASEGAGIRALYKIRTRPEKG